MIWVMITTQERMMTSFFIAEGGGLAPNPPPSAIKMTSCTLVTTSEQTLMT